LAAHRGGINVEAAQDICGGVNANGASGEFEVVIAAVNFDAQSTFKLFDIVVKRAA